MVSEVNYLNGGGGGGIFATYFIRVIGTGDNFTLVAFDNDTGTITSQYFSYTQTGVKIDDGNIKIDFTSGNQETWQVTPYKNCIQVDENGGKTEIAANTVVNVSAMQYRNKAWGYIFS